LKIQNQIRKKIHLSTAIFFFLVREKFKNTLIKLFSSNRSIDTKIELFCFWNMANQPHTLLHHFSFIFSIISEVSPSNYEISITKCSWSMFYWDCILISVVQIVTYYVHSFVKWSSCSYKMKYKGYLELIYRCLLNVMYSELTGKRISYEEITYVYEKAHVIVV
jgi:hypothetical protein